MITADLMKMVIVEKDGKTYLMMVYRYDNEYLNLKIEYDYDHLDMTQFFKDLRERLAQDFDISPQRIELPERQITDKMRQWSLWQSGVIV